MPSVIQAGTASNTALTLTSDTSGELQLRTNNGSTTALTLTTGGNINIPTTGARITGDFSNATIANRVVFQTNTTNGNTGLFVIPNGTATTSSIQLGDNSNLAGSGNTLNLICDGTTASVRGGSYSGGGLPLTFYTGGSERMRIDTSGNVAIANSTARVRLDVRSDAVIAAPTALSSAVSSGVFAIGDSVGSVFGLQLNGSSYDTYIQARNMGAASTAYNLLLQPLGGNVGIGTSSPSSNLEVYGASSAVSRVTAGTEIFEIRNTGSEVRLAVVSADPLTFRTSNVEAMRITSDGDIAIGTTTTNGRRLYIQDTDNAVNTTIYSSNASFQSFVFQTITYKAAGTDYYHYAGYSSDGLDAEFALRGDGNGYADGTWNNNGADYAEYFESATGQSIPVGSTVVLENNKVRLATETDNPSNVIGVVRPKEPSKASMVVGNTAWNKWANKYLTDDFDRYIMEDHDVIEWIDADGKQHSYESHNISSGITVPSDAIRRTHDDKGNKFQHYKLNPAWDPNAEYINRENRDEWLIIGLIGQVKVLKGQVIGERWIKMRDISITVEEWFIR